MLQERDARASAESVGSIIDIIQLGRRTGILIVARGEGTDVEEGRILFANGQISEVHYGEQWGRVALHSLLTWKTCRFTFQADSHKHMS